MHCRIFPCILQCVLFLTMACLLGEPTSAAGQAQLPPAPGEAAEPALSPQRGTGDAENPVPRLEVTVGPAGADFTGSDHLAIQGAVEYVMALGGGTVRLLPGTYVMGNALFLRSGIRIIGSGDATILRKCDAASTPLVDNVDWYEKTIRVQDPSIFRVGGGVWLEGMSPFYQGYRQIAKRTVVAIDGDRLHLDKAVRENFWLDSGAQASNAFPIITGEHITNAIVESLVIEGNGAHNPLLDGNYAGAVFIQDCDRMTLRDLTIRDYNGDAISAQICDDLVIEGCRISDCTNLGIHPGSGCQRPLIRNNTIRGCSQGIFFCWGVRHGLAEGNLIEDGTLCGISIGHRDTDNILRGNTIRRSGHTGLLFRADAGEGRAPDRCVVEGNLIEDSGTKGECVAVEISGTPADLVIRGNRLVDTRPAAAERHRIGIRVAAGALRPMIEGNVFEGMDEDVVDQRAAP